MLRWLFLLISLALIPSVANAHLLPKQTATIRVVDRSAFLVVSVPVSALTGVDDDANGMLSLDEISRHNEAIARQFNARLQVTDSTSTAVPALTMVMSPNTDGESAPTDYVIVLHRVNFSAVPPRPTIRFDLFGTGAGEGQVRVRATQGDRVEVAILSAGAIEHTFFKGALAVMSEYVENGIRHIWAGADHLLFLLTIIIAGAGWRHWLMVITSFTVAHSITLAASTLDVFKVPASVAEPGIALSIVVMAALNLHAHFKGSAAIHVGWPKVAIIFVCGLLHGFGFASAIGAVSLDPVNQAATLAGFNIGIEMGQLAFVASALAMIAALRRLPVRSLADRMPVATSGLAICAGLFWFVERIGVT
jgi:HupE / UreJ protein